MTHDYAIDYVWGAVEVSMAIVSSTISIPFLLLHIAKTLAQFKQFAFLFSVRFSLPSSAPEPSARTITARKS
jgi:hypothetical protein